MVLRTLSEADGNIGNAPTNPLRLPMHHERWVRDLNKKTASGTLAMQRNQRAALLLIHLQAETRPVKLCMKP